MKKSLITLSLIALAGLVLQSSGCFWNDSATVRFKVIAVLEVDGEIREFSNVMQVEYTRVERSALGYGGKSKTWGEALVIDLGERGRTYMLHSHFNKEYSEFSEVYAPSILMTLGLDASVGSLKDNGIDIINEANGRYKLKTYNSYYKTDFVPAFVSFIDEKNPNSIFLIDKDKFSDQFGAGIKFIRIDIETTDEKITQGVLIKYLPWLSKKYKIGFERLPRPNIPPKNEWKLRWKMNFNRFYAGESR